MVVRDEECRFKVTKCDLKKRPTYEIKGSSLLLTHETFPFEKMVPGMLVPEMIEDRAKIVIESIKDKV